MRSLYVLLNVVNVIGRSPSIALLTVPIDFLGVNTNLINE
jgi:hypothetical protein